MMQWLKDILHTPLVPHAPSSAGSAGSAPAMPGPKTVSACSTKAGESGRPASAANASKATRPWATPESVVKNRIENAGCMAVQPSEDEELVGVVGAGGVMMRGKYWLAGWVSHSGISA